MQIETRGAATTLRDAGFGPYVLLGAAGLWAVGGAISGVFSALRAWPGGLWTDDMLIALVVIASTPIAALIALRTPLTTIVLDEARGEVRFERRSVLRSDEQRVPFRDIAAVDVRRDVENEQGAYIDLKLKDGSKVALSRIGQSNEDAERAAFVVRAAIAGKPSA
jgi:hypothetical protein